MNYLKVLVVDDEKNIRKTVSLCLSDEGHRVKSVSNAHDALQECSYNHYDLVMLDLKLGSENGLELIPKLLSGSPWVKIVVITAHASIENAVEAMKRGAADYIEKPFSLSQIIHVVYKISQLCRMERELQLLKAQTGNKDPDFSYSSENPEMQKVISTLQTAAPSDATVLLTGESGTGKSVFAQAIHFWSKRASHPFSVVSCPAMPTELLESELFGYVRGAFTGAVKDYPGRIALCNGGTLFLDEIADMPISTQAKLLHVIQEKKYQRLGDSIEKEADIRIIAATNADLKKRIREGRFREDLYYRLHVISISIPPLRDHKEDIIPLAQGFLTYFSTINHKQIVSFSSEEKNRLMEYNWPGNIRELRNTIERTVILGSFSSLNAELLPFADTSDKSQGPYKAGDTVSLEELEKNHISKIIKNTNTLQEAAELLGIDQTTLWRKRKAYNL